ncbi:hypothetical protein [Spartinivicinus ruber]|uniref:hypothetical protein n=1 Tax=Spartinivicinus ruber TaxID=2683272 RepID=UPI0013D51CFE|nr:hypothetical protein [Spartinivicinus ruber]
MNKDFSNLELQPLRIPAGWFINYNNGFWEIDPDDCLIPEDDRWWIFKEDMLQMYHKNYNCLLDLGWYPEGDLINGSYKLQVFDGDFHGNQLAELRSKGRSIVVSKIENILKLVAEGKLDKIRG